MRNSVSEGSFAGIHTDTDDVDFVEEGHLMMPDGEISDGSDSSSNEPASPRGTHDSGPSSYKNPWPQSYRQSIDLYSTFTPPRLSSFLSSQSLSKLSSSFVSSSSALLKPLIPTSVEDELQKQKQQHQQEEARKSSHQILPPRKPSLPKIPEDAKAASVADKHDPHAIQLPGSCTRTQAVFNGLNVLCGVGILSTPFAVKEGGWLGLLILSAFAIISFYTGILLRQCLKTDDALLTYPDIGGKAFGSTGRIIVSIVLYVELYACCVEYLILEGDNLSYFFPNAQISLGGFQITSRVLFATLATLIVTPTTWLPDLKLLSYVSAGGVVASILIFFLLPWVAIVDHVGFQNRGSLLNIHGMPLAIGLYGYCYSGHAVFPNIYTSLKDRNHYPQVIGICFTFCFLLFGGVAVMGYMMFGESTQSQFTLNMPQNLIASKIAIATTVVNPITKFAITMTPMAMSLEELLPNQHKSHKNAIIIRTLLVFSSLGVALSVPFFDLVMALVGSLLTMLVTLIFPCLCYLVILKRNVPWFERVFCYLIILTGSACAIIGTASAVYKIYLKYT